MVRTWGSDTWSQHQDYSCQMTCTYAQCLWEMSSLSKKNKTLKKKIDNYFHTTIYRIHESHHMDWDDNMSAKNLELTLFSYFTCGRRKGTSGKKNKVESDVWVGDYRGFRLILVNKKPKIKQLKTKQSTVCWTVHHEQVDKLMAGAKHGATCFTIWQNASW